MHKAGSRLAPGQVLRGGSPSPADPNSIHLWDLACGALLRTDGCAQAEVCLLAEIRLKILSHQMGRAALGTASLT